MGVVIWIIVIIIFISSIIRNNAVGKSKKEAAGSRQSDTAESQQSRSYEQVFRTKQAKPNQPKPGTKTAKPNQPKPRTVQAQAKPNAATGEPVRPRYDSYKQAKQEGRSASSATHQLHVDDILESARENNQAVQIDNDIDSIEIGDLMAKVQDNIVMGPADVLSFQRDFVAEGMDLLNRYTLIPGAES